MFSQSELAEAVQGGGQEHGQNLVLAYSKVKEMDDSPHLLKYNKASGAAIRSDAKWGKSCLGAIEDIQFIGEFALVSMHINPSAEILWIVDKDLKPRMTLYGFRPLEVTPG
ncbi:MAG TPA: hypothetical protein VNW54_11670 [Granulicella sp.]|nr:hypothetical protein [Granulicella sp.]